MPGSGDQQRPQPPAAGDGPVPIASGPRLVVARLGEPAPGLEPGEGGTTHEVESIAALLAAVHGDGADAVIVSAPLGRGAPAVAELRADPAAAGVPVLVISPVDDAEDRLRAYEAGANDYIGAPVPPRELAARIAAAAGLRAGKDTTRPFLERVLSGIDDALVVLDREWRYRFANERVGELTGVPRETLLGRDIWSVFPGLAETSFAEAARAAMEEREFRRARFDYPPLDLVFDARISPCEEGITVFARDVTEAARARAAVEASEARFRALAGSVAEVFWIFGCERYGYDYVTPTVTTVFGVEPEALYADADRPRRLLVDPGEWVRFVAPRSGGDPHRTMRFRIQRPDGALRWVESRSYPFGEREADRARWICGISRDVTAEVSLEQRLAADRDQQSERARDLERRFRLLIESTREYAIYMLDTEGRITTWNEGAQRLTGYDEAAPVDASRQASAESR